MSKSDVSAQIALIPGRLSHIFTSSDKRKLPTNVIADLMAESIVAAAAS
jgi:hypothetical protein